MLLIDLTHYASKIKIFLKILKPLPLYEIHANGFKHQRAFKLKPIRRVRKERKYDLEFSWRCQIQRTVQTF